MAEGTATAPIIFTSEKAEGKLPATGVGWLSVFSSNKYRRRTC